MADQEIYDYLAKVVLIGDSGVGKSNLMLRYTMGKFFIDSKSTVGVEFSTKCVTCENKTLKAQIWDTAGQERYKSITNAYYRSAVGALIVFDVTKELSYMSVPRWLKELRQYAHTDVIVVLVASKTDLLEEEEVERAVSREDCESYAKSEGILYTECSAKDNSNVEQAFMLLFNEIYSSLKSEGKEENGDSGNGSANIVQEIKDPERQSKAGGCC
eukprot:TRINITY_DN9627_c0_g1_i1.p1 TRINITY_DN9627_c0_g1~~TRINITY_DN9627_c0_g1_i1.p1  ORF type:complete len:215 (-),score=49.91 TRINITY_DN9627_c0_g1_i1:83-727(-)